MSSCPLGFMAALTLWLLTAAFVSPMLDLPDILQTYKYGTFGHIGALWNHLRIEQLISKRWRVLELLELVSSQSLEREDRERKTRRQQAMSPKRANHSSEVIPRRGLFISVLTYNRPHSLVRLLESLSRSHYLGHRVDLLISVDLNRDGLVHSETLRAAKSYEWPHGKLTVRLRERHYGLAEQWIHAIPEDRLKQDNGTVLLILEDDIEVSPFFFKWLLKAHAAYGTREDVSGFTLQRAIFRGDQRRYHGKHVSVHQGVFLYPLVGTIGYSALPVAWQRFVRWYASLRVDGRSAPLVPHIIATHYLLSLSQRNTSILTSSSSWGSTESALDYFNHIHGLYCVYGNAPDYMTLAAHHHEPGEHFSSRKMDALPLPKWQDEWFVFPDPPVVLGTDGEPIQ